jgi:hypothetical protein
MSEWVPGEAERSLLDSSVSLLCRTEVISFYSLAIINKQDLKKPHNISLCAVSQIISSSTASSALVSIAIKYSRVRLRMNRGAANVSGWQFRIC